MQFNSNPFNISFGEQYTGAQQPHFIMKDITHDPDSEYRIVPYSDEECRKIGKDA